MNVISILETALNYITLVRITDIIDMVIIAFLVYKLLSIVKSSNAANILRGILLFIVALWLSRILQLNTTNYILSHVVEWGIIAIIILFQPEIRQLLEHLGGRSNVNFLKLFAHDVKATEVEKAIDQIVLACSEMSQTKTGVLLIFERNIELNEMIRTGTTFDASITSELLKNIFFINAPMHDGACIVRNGRIIAAGCMLPLSKNVNLSKELGMRHRAGIGISETTDAVSVIVSEETGSISVAIGGMLKRHLVPETLEKLLKNELLPKEEVPERRNTSLFKLIKQNFDEVIDGKERRTKN